MPTEIDARGQEASVSVSVSVSAPVSAPVCVSVSVAPQGHRYGALAQRHLPSRAPSHIPAAHARRKSKDVVVPQSAAV
jgi:hypothetical protein